MDPTAVLVEMLHAFDQDDRDNAIESALSLAEWLTKGGFMPRVTVPCCTTDAHGTTFQVGG